MSAAEWLRRLLSPFVLLLTLLTAAIYTYVAMRLADGLAMRCVLAMPFLLIWLVPVIYWAGQRDQTNWLDHWLHYTSYLSMGWLSFVFILELIRDGLEVFASALNLLSVYDLLETSGSGAVLFLSLAAVASGALRAGRGPGIKTVDIAIANLPASLVGFRIVQISDLHVGPSIRQKYVERVVRIANELKPDLVALTGDIIDGRVADLTKHVAPLRGLTPSDRLFFITGNHEYYSGAAPWLDHFATLGMTILSNSHVTLTHGDATLLIAGVVDPAVRITGSKNGPDPAAAAAGGTADIRILLAHNPKIAALAEPVGFDLQLSGHTHGGQFFPWTLVTRMVHAPHFVGLSRRGKMWVYVSAGTGTWGPPIRFGSESEITLVRLVGAV